MSLLGFPIRQDVHVPGFCDIDRAAIVIVQIALGQRSAPCDFDPCHVVFVERVFNSDRDVNVSVGSQGQMGLVELVSFTRDVKDIKILLSANDSDEEAANAVYLWDDKDGYVENGISY